MNAWYKTATWWFTLAALSCTALLTVKLFAPNSSGEKLLLAANLILGGLGFKSHRKDVKEALHTEVPEKE